MNGKAQGRAAWTNGLGPIVAITASFFPWALLLWLEGRRAFCACGFSVWSGDTCSASNSQQLFDPYSFTHVLHGFVLFWLVTLIARRAAPSWRLWLALALGAAWGGFENSRFLIDLYLAIGRAT